MRRQEDFFNEATKQIKDSYVFQSDGTYSDDDVRDIATSLAEYGYQYAKKMIEDYLLCVELSNFFPTLSDEDADKGKEVLTKSIKEFLEEM